jgi:hypothetical protein
MEVRNKVFSKDYSLKKYIKITKNGMPLSVCDIILSEYENCNDWKDFNSQSQIILLNKEATTSEKRIYINNLISSSFCRLSFIIELKKTYDTLFPITNGFNLIKQNTIVKNDILEKITYKNKNSDLVCITQLNSEYEGGDICFFDQEYKINLKKGDILTFPLHTLYEYQIFPLISGKRYFLIYFMDSLSGN